MDGVIMTALDLEAIRKLIPGEWWHAKGTMLDEIVIQSESDPRVAEFGRWEDADTAANAVNALGPLCDEVDRLTKDLAERDAELEEELARVEYFEDAVAKVHMDLGGDGEWSAKVGAPSAPGETGNLAEDVHVMACEITTDYDRLRAENAKLREVAERVLKVFPIIESESVIADGKPPVTYCDYCHEPPTEHTETCLRAQADLALRGGEPIRSEP